MWTRLRVAGVVLALIPPRCGPASVSRAWFRAMANLAGHAAKAAASQRLSELASDLSHSSSARLRPVKINWEDFNFPFRREPCNILHFDLVELKRQDERAHDTVRFVYWWWLLLLAVVMLNLLNSIIIVAGVGNDDIYRALNVVYSVFNVFLALSIGTFAMYNVYRGLADHSREARRQGTLALACLLACGLIQAFLGAGNTNGFGSFGSDRLEAAKALDLGVVGYWEAAIVIESLLWLANVAVGVFVLYRVVTY